MPSANIPCVAGGNILPSRIVKIDATADNRVIVAGVGDVPFGVSGPATRNPPYSTLNDTFAAIAGEPIRVFQAGEEATVEAGAAITRGARLTADSVGRAITAGAAVASVGVASQSASGAGALIQCQINLDTQGAS